MKEILFIIIAVIFFKNIKSEGFALSKDDIPKAIANKMNLTQEPTQNMCSIREKGQNNKCPIKETVEDKNTTVEVDITKEQQKMESRIEGTVKESERNTNEKLKKIEEINSVNTLVNDKKTEAQTKEIQNLIISTSNRELEQLNKIDESIQELKKRPIVKYPTPDVDKNVNVKVIMIILGVLLIILFIYFMMNQEPVIRRKIIRPPPLPPPPPPKIKLSFKEAKEIATKNLMKYDI